MKILHDLFPAHFAVMPENVLTKVQDLSSHPITEGAYGMTKARVIVSERRVWIALDSNEGPQVVFSEEYDEFHKSNVREYDSYIITKGGRMVAYKYDANCGCGSRLRGWSPYRHVYSEKDPTE
jgi:hypothetical protein